MYKITLGILEYASIDIYTRMDKIACLFRDKKEKITKTIPITDISVSNVLGAEKIEGFIYIFDSLDMKMNYDLESNVAILEADESKIRFPDLVYICLTLLSKELLKKEKYLVHSSVLKYNDDDAIMLIGEANAGKTSLAYNLMRDYNYKLISNDHALVGFENGNIRTYTGTKELEMRDGVIKYSFPELGELIDLNLDDEALWRQKTIVNDYLRTLGYQEDNESRLTDVYQIATINGADTFIKEKDRVDQKLYLYEQFCRTIKNNYGLIVGFSYPMPSLENKEVLRQLNKNIDNSLDNVNVYIAKGDIADVSYQLGKRYGKR